ncbi:unnamed protein product, partial [marine sediment metagenome]
MAEAEAEEEEAAEVDDAGEGAGAPGGSPGATVRRDPPDRAPDPRGIPGPPDPRG